MRTDWRETADNHIHLPNADPASSCVSTIVFMTVFVWILVQIMTFIVDIMKPLGLHMIWEFPFFRLVGS